MQHARRHLKAVLLSVFLVVQTAMQPSVVRRYLKHVPVTSACIMITEIIKVLTCIILYQLSKSPRLSKQTPGRGTTMFDGFTTAAGAAVVYSVQNIAITAAQKSLDGLSYNILNQTKLLSAALMSYLVLGRRQSRMQILSLVALVAAASMAVVSTRTDGEMDTFGDFSGVVAALVASSLSGLSGALSDKALQVRSRNSFLFSAELSFYVLLTMVVGYAVDYLVNGPFSNVSRIHAAGGLLAAAGIQSVSSIALIPICLAAFGGILVGQVTKLVGSVRKGFAVCAGIVVTALVDHSGSEGGLLLYLSIPLAVAAVVTHSLYSSKSK